MDPIPSRCDVLVVGGGPAGNAAATVLAKEDLDVVLIDKARHPRPNVGESLIPQFWRFTDLIGASEAIEADGFVKKAGGIGLWRNRAGRIRFKDFGYTRSALHVERDRFDHILLKNSRRHGVRVFEETLARKIDLGDNGGAVHWQTADGEQGVTRVRYIVDASGQSAVLARQLKIRQFDPDIRFTALWGYYEGGEYLDFDGNPHPFEERFDTPPVTIQASLGDWGWVWHIVMRDSVSVGLILPPERLQAFKARDDSKESKFQDIVAESPIVGRLMEDARYVGPFYAIRDYAYLPTQLVIQNCFLAGDAAAFVDPINSAGVSFGMYAGYLSAWAITRSLHHPERKDDFREMYTRLYGDRLALFRLVAMPSDAPGYLEAVEKGLDGAKNTGDAEKWLMLSQAALTSRSEGVLEIFERMGVKIESGTLPLSLSTV